MLADPAEYELAMRKMDIMDDYFDQILTSVERANVLRLHEMESYSRVARAYFQRVYALAIGAIAVGVVISIVAMLLIADSILRPLQTLQTGVRKFGSGSLSHRIGQLSTDEFGKLALAFDTMADRLEEMAARDSSSTKPLLLRPVCRSGVGPSHKTTAEGIEPLRNAAAILSGTSETRPRTGAWRTESPAPARIRVDGGSRPARRSRRPPPRSRVSARPPAR